MPDPQSLVGARIAAHHAAQWLARAARANLAPEPDDSHSSLGWDATHAALVTQPIGKLRLGLRLDNLNLFIARGGTPEERLELAGASEAEAGRWVDAELEKAQLQPASGVKLPYDIGAPPAQYALEPEAALLARWVDDAAAVLEAFRARHKDLQPGPSPVRCWPHHFDIATLVALEAGDPEHARSIGVGVSPGDASYAEPYAYISPWPKPDAARLPAAPAPGHWHTQGFVALVATARELEGAGSRRAALAAFVEAAFAACQTLPGKGG